MQSENSTFKPALMLMSGRALAFTVTFFVPVLLVRIFSQEEFGTYKQFFLITYTLFIIGQLGLSECLYYFLPARPSAGGRYVFNSMVTLWAAGMVFSAGLMVFAERIADWFSNPALAGYIPLIGPYIVFMLMGTLLETTMVIRKRYRWATATYVVSDIVRALLLVLPAVMTRNLEWLFIGGIAFCLLRVAGTFFYLKVEFGREIRFDGALLRQQIRYALPFALYVLVDFAHVNYHNFAVSYFFGVATFAIYSVGCLQIPLVDFIGTPAANIMMVRMGEEIREGRTNRLPLIWHDNTRKLALVFGPIVALLVVSAHHLIVLMYTEAYAESAPIFMVWSLFILMAPIQTDSVMRVFAQTRFLLLINIIRLTATALLINWFLSTFSLIGAVLVTLLGTMLAKTLALIRIKNLMHVSFARLLPWRNLGGIFGTAALAALPSLVLTTHLRIEPLYLVPISGAVYMIVYSALILNFGLLTPGEKQAIFQRLFSVYARNRRSRQGSVEF